MGLFDYLSKVTPGRCKRKSKTHVFRFNRYAGPWNFRVHPNSPDRKPKFGIFRCTECGYEIRTAITHKP